MQSFTTYQAEAAKLAPALVGKPDDDWKMIVDDEKFEISDGYDLTRKDNLYSLYCKARLLAGTDWKTLHPGVTLDRIQITRTAFDTCGCVATFTWDRDTPEHDRPIHPHKGEVHCEHHVHLKDDHAAHYWECRAENGHTFYSVRAVATSMIAKYVEDNRELLEHMRLRALAEAPDGTEIKLEDVALLRLHNNIKYEHKKGKDGKRALHIDHPTFTDMNVVKAANEAVNACPHASKRDCHIHVKAKPLE